MFFSQKAVMESIRAPNAFQVLDGSVFLWPPSSLNTSVFGAGGSS